MGNLRNMLNAKAVALVGATEKEGAVGRTILENLLRWKEGKVFPVNPNNKKVLEVDALSGHSQHPRTRGSCSHRNARPHRARSS